MTTWSIKETTGIAHRKAWMIIRIEDGRELRTHMVYGRKKHALLKVEELSKS